MTDRDIGVPGCVARALLDLAGRISPPRLDRVWIFPPLVRGRSERGLVAAGCFVEGERRLLVTVAYGAEETGKGVAYDSLVQEEGEAPEDRLPRVMEGVVKRLDAPQGVARSIALNGDSDAFDALVREYLAPGASAAPSDGTTTAVEGAQPSREETST